MDGVVILSEEGIEVTNGLGRAGNLNTGDDGESVTLGSSLSQTYGIVQIRLDTVLVGLTRTDDIGVGSLCTFGKKIIQEINHLLLVGAVLQVLGDSQHIQTLQPSLLNTELGRNATVREDRVGVKVGLKDRVSIHLRKDNLAALTRLVLMVAQQFGISGILIMCLGRCCRCHKQSSEEKKFFHIV